MSQFFSFHLILPVTLRKFISSGVCVFLLFFFFASRYDRKEALSFPLKNQGRRSCCKGWCYLLWKKHLCVCVPEIHEQIHPDEQHDFRSTFAVPGLMVSTNWMWYTTKVQHLWPSSPFTMTSRTMKRAGAIAWWLFMIAMLLLLASAVSVTTQTPKVTHMTTPTYFTSLLHTLKSVRVNSSSHVTTERTSGVSVSNVIVDRTTSDLREVHRLGKCCYQLFCTAQWV